MEHPGDDWPRSLRRGGASIALPRRDKELYVTQILSIFVPSISLSLSLFPRISVSTELKCSKPRFRQPLLRAYLSF